MWISGGDNELAENIVHMVLARTPDAPPGTRGISLFIVPKYLPDGQRNDITLAGINHKLGYRGTVNTAPVFGDGAFTPGGATRRRRLPRRRREPRPAVDVRHDERGPDQHRRVRHRTRATPAT